MSGPYMRRLTVLCLGSALATFALLASGPATAEKVGVAAAVKPDAFSEGKEVKIGNSVFYNQRINTAGEGLVQVLLVDGSTFTVGPGSDLVIDKFVYDPSKGKGEVVASFSKGVMRFVGGKISKNEGGVTVNTPSGALAIRGGMFQGTPNLFSFLFGVEMKFTGRNGVVNRVYQPGYTLDLKGGVPTVRPTTADDTAFFMKALAGGGKVVVGGAKTDNPNPGSLFKKKVDTAEITQEGTQNVIIGQLDKEEAHVPPPPPPPPAGGNEEEAEVRVLQTPTKFTAFLGTDQETEVGNGYYDSPGSHGVLGGSDPVTIDDQPVDETADDFNMTLNRQGDRLVGVFDVVSVNNADYEGPFAEQVSGSLSLPAEFDASECTEFGVCVVTDATLEANVTGPGGETRTVTETLKGSAVVVGAGFVAYQLFHPNGDQDQGPYNNALSFSDNANPYWGGWTLGDLNGRTAFAQYQREIYGAAANVNLNDPLLIFAGKKFNMNTPGEVRDFLLFTDPRQSFVVTENGENVVVPFATMEASPFKITHGENASISKLSVLQKTAGDSESRSVWLQTSMLLNHESTSGNEQESIVVVALGEMSNTNGLTGNRRGGSSLNVTRNFIFQTTEPIAFTGGISTLPGSNGAHFMGDKTPNIVIGADSTGQGHNVFYDEPLYNPEQGSASATYHVGVGSPNTKKPDQTGGTFHGYAAGVFQQTTHSYWDSPGGVLMSDSADDVEITFNKRRNTLDATINTNVAFEGEDAGGLSLALGDPNGDSHGHSAYIDDTHFAAIESATGTQVLVDGDEGGSVPVDPESVTAYMASGDQLGVTKFFQDTFAPNQEDPNSLLADDPAGKAFCKDCAFIKWGAWGTNVKFKDGISNDADDVAANVHLGWWVAGDMASTGELDNLAAKGATASYNGNAIGTVASTLGSGIGWKTYVAAGDMHMGWDFAARSGQLDITKFDTKHFGPEGLSFGGLMSAPGQLNTYSINKFSGSLSGQLPNDLGSVNGLATGSFVNRGTGVNGVANGVVGNWGVGSNVYKATGVFAGGGKPIPGAPH
jgi:hypothetical protein